MKLENFFIPEIKYMLKKPVYSTWLPNFPYRCGETRGLFDQCAVLDPNSINIRWQVWKLSAVINDCKKYPKMLLYVFFNTHDTLVGVQVFDE